MMKTSTALCMMMILALCITQPVLAQEGKKSVTLKITKEMNGQRTVIDTSFTVTHESEIDGILEQLGVGEPKPNQSIEKEIVIRELDSDKTRNAFGFHFDTSNSRPMLGVWLDDDEDEAGVRISGVTPNSGAQAAGLRQGDVLTEVAGREVNEEEDIAEALSSYQPGDDVAVVYLRDERVNTTTVNLKPGVSVFQTPSTSGKNHNFNYNYNYNFDDFRAKGLSGNTERAFLGIYPETTDEATARENGLTGSGGVYLNKVVPQSAAEAAGLQKGDIITHLNETRIEGTKGLTEFLDKQKPGNTLDIRYVRNGQSRNTTAKLGKQASHALASGARMGSMREVKKAYLGVYLEDEEEGGVRITRVSPNTAADDAGLEAGDVITGMDNVEIDTYHDLSEAMQEFEPGQEIRLQFERKGKVRRERVVLGEKTSTTWFSGDDEDADEEVDIEIIIRDFDDPEAGENLRRFMESPSLNLNGFNYFPNPNDGKFRLQFDLPDTGDLKIRVYSPEGKVLYEEFKQGFSGGYNQEIDLSEFVSEGIYFLQLTQNGKGMADKIIVR